MKSVYLIGVGRHAIEVSEYLDDQENLSLTGYIIDDHFYQPNINSSKSICSVSQFIQNVQPSNTVCLFNAIGDPKRREIIELLEAKKYSFLNIIHSKTYISKSVSLGIGNCIAPGCSINANVTIGNHCIINLNCSVSHDTIIHDYVTLSPGVAIAGNVEIGKSAFLGVGSSVIPKVKIGEGAYIAAGACVTKDVQPFTLVGGVPAKLIKKI